MRKIIGLLTVIVMTVSLPAQEAPADAWTLEECIDYAVRNNINVQKSELTKTTAEINLKQEKDNRLPSISGSTSAKVSNGSSLNPVTYTYNNKTSFTNSFGIDANFTLYQGNKQNLLIEKNEILLKENELYVTEAKNDITLTVLDSYLQALYYYEAVIVSENSAKSTEEQLKQTRVRFKNGAIAKLELAEMETQYASDLYTIVNNQSLYEQQVLKLKQLLEIDPLQDFQISSSALSEVSTLVPDKEEVYWAATLYMPDLKIYDVQKEAAIKDLELAKTGYLPTVSLTAGISTGYSDTNSIDYFKQLDGNLAESVGLSVSIPIFSKNQNKTNQKIAEISVQQTELSKIQASKDLYSKVETAWHNANSYQAQTKAAKVARDNAKLAYDLTGKKHEFGGLTPTELSVSRNSYLNAEQNYIQTKYMALLYLQLLNFYQGKSITNL